MRYETPILAGPEVPYESPLLVDVDRVAAIEICDIGSDTRGSH